MTTITNNVTLSGVGLWKSSTIPAYSVSSSPAYSPDLDPRLPKHSTLVTELASWANSEIQVSDIGLFADPSLTANTKGAVRVSGEVIWYANVWTGNSRLTSLTREIAGTVNSAISGNVSVGSLITALGLRTVSS